MDDATAERAIPRSCSPEPDGRVPVVDRNRCEAKGDCVDVCPYDVFALRALTAEEKSALGLVSRLKLFAHGGRQAFVVAPERCHACGLCVAACPERALRLSAGAPAS